MNATYATIPRFKLEESQQPAADCKITKFRDVVLIASTDQALDACMCVCVCVRAKSITFYVVIALSRPTISINPPDPADRRIIIRITEPKVVNRPTTCVRGN